MGKGCSTEGCENEHHSSGSCKLHYRMPSQKNPKPIRRKIAIAFHGTLASSPRPTEKITLEPKKSKKPKQETLPQLLKRAEKVFNARIRKRDLLSDNTFKCISCGLFKRKSEMDAGHFYPKTYSILRFDEDNVHGECITCNRLNDKHLEQYRVNLEAKIGWVRLQRLDYIKNYPFKWDRNFLLNLIENYK